jgi:hypothetical protein
MTLERFKMGDRATFVIEAEQDQTFYLYGHWAGEGMMDRLATALEAAYPRILMDDQIYASRIIISYLIGDEWSSETGWGLTTYFCDSEHSVPVVDLKTQTVRLLPHTWDTKFDINAKPKFVMGIDAFIRKFSKVLV